MKRVALVTSIYNYGSILQCFATYKYINSLGVKCDYIEYVPDENKKTLNSFRRNFFKPNTNEFVFEHYMKDKTYLLNEKKFVLNYIKPINYSINLLKQIDRKSYYGTFIAGGDQIWNSSNVFSIDGEYHKFLFLQFINKAKKVSFCTSFGSSEIGVKNEKLLKEYLNNIDMFSVREEFGKHIINKYNKKKVQVLSDPIVLYSKNQWKNIYSKNTKLKIKNYIFLHFLNVPSDTAIKAIKDYVNKNKSNKIIAFYGGDDHFRNIKNIKIIKGSPFDYLYLINNAKFVITDSFHTSLFSIIFNKEFLVFNRKDYCKNQTSRLDDLINKYNCHNNYIKDEKDISFEKCRDYIIRANKQLKIYQAKEKQYIDKILNI